MKVIIYAYMGVGDFIKLAKTDIFKHFNHITLRTDKVEIRDFAFYEGLIEDCVVIKKWGWLQLWKYLQFGFKNRHHYRFAIFTRGHGFKKNLVLERFALKVEEICLY